MNKNLQKLAELGIEDIWFENYTSMHINPIEFDTLIARPTFSHFLMGSFVWSESPQGFRFWDQIASKNNEETEMDEATREISAAM